jgi:hypothetical protein
MVKTVRTDCDKIKKMEGEIKKINNKNETNPQEVSSEIVKKPSMVTAVGSAIAIDMLGPLAFLTLQGIDAGCGKHCVPFGFILIVIVYYISIIYSSLLAKKSPISVGMYIIASSFASLVLSLMLGIIPFIILLYSGAKMLEQNWKKVEGQEKTNQVIVGLMLIAITVFLCMFFYFSYLV